MCLRQLARVVFFSASTVATYRSNACPSLPGSIAQELVVSSFEGVGGPALRRRRAEWPARAGARDASGSMAANVEARRWDERALSVPERVIETRRSSSRNSAAGGGFAAWL